MSLQLAMISPALPKIVAPRGIRLGAKVAPRDNSQEVPRVHKNCPGPVFVDPLFWVHKKVYPFLCGSTKSVPAALGPQKVSPSRCVQTSEPTKSVPTSFPQFWVHFLWTQFDDFVMEAFFRNRALRRMIFLEIVILDTVRLVAVSAARRSSAKVMAQVMKSWLKL